MPNDWPKEYAAIWDTFVGQMTDFHKRLADAVPATPPGILHKILADLHGIPYVKAKGLLDEPAVDRSSRNPGAVTGLFFEQAVVGLIVPYLRNRLPGARFERNSCSVLGARAITRDPDLFVANGDRFAVFEVKVSPKKRDLDYVERICADYQRAGIGYYLVGGEISAHPEIFERYSAREWACFVSAPKTKRDLLKRLPTLDVVLQAAVRHLVGV